MLDHMCPADHFTIGCKDMHGTLDTSVVAGMWKVEDEGGGGEGGWGGLVYGSC